MDRWMSLCKEWKGAGSSRVRELYDRLANEKKTKKEGKKEEAKRRRSNERAGENE